MQVIMQNLFFWILLAKLLPGRNNRKWNIKKKQFRYNAHTRYFQYITTFIPQIFQGSRKYAHIWRSDCWVRYCIKFLCMKTIYSWDIFLGIVNKLYSSTGITFLNRQVCLYEMIANHLHFAIWNINQNCDELCEHLKDIWLLGHRSVTFYEAWLQLEHCNLLYDFISTLTSKIIL